jgi:hypothetical protein
LPLNAQVKEAVYSDRIKTPQLYVYGNQLAYPVIRLNSTDRLELHFDDLDANVKNYYYTFQLCDADWKPCMLSTFDFISGFSQQRITQYRSSSIAFTRYTHYQAVLPDRNCMPTRSGNYILKVYLNGDTSRLAFTKRFLVVDEKASIAAQIQQPFSGQIFRTHQKIQFRVNLSERLNVVNHAQQVKVVILQITAGTMRPPIYAPVSIRATGLNIIPKRRRVSCRQRMAMARPAQFPLLKRQDRKANKSQTAPRFL